VTPAGAGGDRWRRRRASWLALAFALAAAGAVALLGCGAPRARLVLGAPGERAHDAARPGCAFLYTDWTTGAARPVYRCGRD